MKIRGFRIDIPYEFSADRWGSIPQCLLSYPLNNEITGVWAPNFEGIGNLEKFFRQNLKKPISLYLKE